MAGAARQALGRGGVGPRRFGARTVPPDRVVVFPDGLIGFRDARRFALLEPDPADSPLLCLVSLDTPELGFVVCDPTTRWPDYAADLGLVGDLYRDGPVVLAIVTLPPDPRAMTVDLLAPLVIDWETRTGRQIVLDSGRYSTRHPLLSTVEAHAAGEREQRSQED